MCLEVASVATIADVDDDNDDYNDDADSNETDSGVQKYHLRNRVKRYLQNTCLDNVFLTSCTERRPAQPWPGS